MVFARIKKVYRDHPLMVNAQFSINSELEKLGFRTVATDFEKLQPSELIKA